MTFSSVGLFSSTSQIERLQVDTNEPMGCLPISLGLNVAAPLLKSLQIVASDPNGTMYSALQLPKDLQCPFPAQVMRTALGLEGSWPSINRSYGALAKLTDLAISGTAAVFNMTDFTCKPTCVFILPLSVTLLLCQRHSASISSSTSVRGFCLCTAHTSPLVLRQHLHGRTT